MKQGHLFTTGLLLAMLTGCSTAPDEAATEEAVPPPMENIAPDTVGTSTQVSPPDTEIVIPPTPVASPVPPPARAAVKMKPPRTVYREVEEPPPTQEELPDMDASITTEGEEDYGVVAPVGTEQEEVFTFVEQMPQFPGGEAAFQAYLVKNLQYPEMEREAGIQGKVYASFVVDRDGKITDVKVVRGVSPGLDREALRVLKAMPNWSRGKQSGRAVAVRMTVPVRFVLE